MPGAARQQVTLFCLPKIQVTKQNGTHPHRPFGLPSIFRKDRAAAELALCAQTVLADGPRSFRKTEAVQRGIWVLWAEPGFVLDALPAGESGVGLVSWSPWSAAEQHSRVGGSRRGLSERVARVPQRPGSASSAGNPAGAVDWGGFLWILSLVRTKKVSRPPGGPGTQTNGAHSAPYKTTKDRTTQP